MVVDETKNVHLEYLGMGLIVFIPQKYIFKVCLTTHTPKNPRETFT